MGLIESISNKGNVRGITLNNQLIDLFDFIDTAKSREEASNSINKYLHDILQANKLSKEMDRQRLNRQQRIKKVVQEKVENIENKEEFLKFLLENAMEINANWESRENLESFLEGKEIDSSYIDAILSMKKYFTYQNHGILTCLVDENGKTINPDEKNINVDREKTYQKVEALYEYITGKLENGENRFNRITLDGQGKFGTVAGGLDNKDEAEAEPKDYNLYKLRKGYEFAKKHGMDVRINTLVFFKDFPDRLVGESADAFKTALLNYGKAVATIVNEYNQKGVPSTIDIFNEFVDYNEPFLERTNNWMSKLSIEDLCEIALEIEKEMPEADFGYNDWNFENPEKRKSIFEVLGKIKKFEKRNNCKIIDHIGTQCHTSINDIDGLIESIAELEQFGIPVDVTELDISKGLDGVDLSLATKEEKNAILKYEQKMQNEVMKILKIAVETGKLRGITVWSVTDELCTDFCEGKEASITKMSYDLQKGFTFSDKDMNEQIEISEEEIQLIENHKMNVKRNQEKQIKISPIQDFCFHTHTQRCGHAAKDTGDEEWIREAIKGGIKKLGFTDHMPLPDGENHTAGSRMDIAELESYLTEIYYFKEKYKDKIDIETGFEFEYSDRDLAHLKSLRAVVDKMVLGQHFVVAGEKDYAINRNGGKQIRDEVLDLYLESIKTAMDKGLPDVIAHPDLFMKARDSFGEKEEKVAREICKKSAEKGIPLEINLGKIASKVESKKSIEQLKNEIKYPSPEFWKIVAEETKIAKENGQDIIVFFGKDAHYPAQLSDERDYEIAKAIIGENTLEQLHIVTSYKELEAELTKQKKPKKTQDFLRRNFRRTKRY